WRTMVFTSIWTFFCSTKRPNSLPNSSMALSFAFVVIASSSIIWSRTPRSRSRTFSLVHLLEADIWPHVWGNLALADTFVVFYKRVSNRPCIYQPLHLPRRGEVFGGAVAVVHCIHTALASNGRLVNRPHQRRCPLHPGTL